LSAAQPTVRPVGGQLPRASPFRWLIRSFIAAGCGILLTSTYVRFRYQGHIRDPSNVPPAPVALVFGAGLASRTEPSKMLADRVNTAVELYRSGKVQRLLLSGDNSERHHDETKAMRQHAQSRGLPAESLLRDFGGVSTYDSCYRAKAVFGVQRAILVTQAFHLPRALFIANSLGLEAYGVPAKSSVSLSNEIREFFARPVALALVAFHSRPRFEGEKAP
jgi:SanA protein